MSSNNLSIEDWVSSDVSEFTRDKETQTSSTFITDSFDLVKGPSRPLPKGIDKSDVDSGITGIILDYRVLKDSNDATSPSLEADSFINQIENTTPSITTGEISECLSTQNYGKDVARTYLKTCNDECVVYREDDTESIEELIHDALDPDYEPCFEISKGIRDIQKKIDTVYASEMDPIPNVVLDQDEMKNENKSNSDSDTTEVNEETNNQPTPESSSGDDVPKANSVPEDRDLPNDVTNFVNEFEEPKPSISMESISAFIKESLTALKQSATSYFEKIEVVIGVKKTEIIDKTPSVYPLEKPKTNVGPAENVQTETGSISIESITSSIKESLTALQQSAGPYLEKIIMGVKNSESSDQNSTVYPLEKPQKNVNPAENVQKETGLDKRIAMDQPASSKHEKVEVFMEPKKFENSDNKPIIYPSKEMETNLSPRENVQKDTGLDKRIAMEPITPGIKESPAAMDQSASSKNEKVIVIEPKKFESSDDKPIVYPSKKSETNLSSSENFQNETKIDKGIAMDQSSSSNHEKVQVVMEPEKYENSNKKPIVYPSITRESNLSPAENVQTETGLNKSISTESITTGIIKGLTVLQKSASYCREKMEVVIGVKESENSVKTPTLDPLEKTDINISPEENVQRETGLNRFISTESISTGIQKGYTTLRKSASSYGEKMGVIIGVKKSENTDEESTLDPLEKTNVSHAENVQTETGLNRFISTESITTGIQKGFTAIKSSASCCREKMDVIIGVKKSENTNKEPTLDSLEKTEINVGHSENNQTETGLNNRISSTESITTGIQKGFTALKNSASSYSEKMGVIIGIKKSENIDKESTLDPLKKTEINVSHADNVQTESGLNRFISTESISTGIQKGYTALKKSASSCRETMDVIIGLKKPDNPVIEPSIHPFADQETNDGSQDVQTATGNSLNSLKSLLNNPVEKLAIFKGACQNFAENLINNNEKLCAVKDSYKDFAEKLVNNPSETLISVKDSCKNFAENLINNHNETLTTMKESCKNFAENLFNNPDGKLCAIKDSCKNLIQSERFIAIKDSCKDFAENLGKDGDEKINAMKETCKDYADKLYSSSKETVTLLKEESTKLFSKSHTEDNSTSDEDQNESDPNNITRNASSECFNDYIIKRVENESVELETPKAMTGTSKLINPFKIPSAVRSSFNKIKDDIIFSRFDKSSKYDKILTQDPVPPKAPTPPEPKMPTVSAIDYTPDPPTPSNVFEIIRSKIFSIFGNYDRSGDPSLQNDEEEDPFERFMEQ